MSTTTTSLRRLPAAELLDAALGYAARGWHVFPTRPGTKKPATPNHPAHLCDRTDPRCHDGHTGWEQRATNDPDRITRAWTTRPYGIAIACGPSRLVVLDLDTPTDPEAPGGAPRLAELETTTGEPLPATFTVQTPSGGSHRYFAAPASAPVLGNTASRIAPRIDTRATGGYVLAPPTQLGGPDHAYQTVRDIDELPELPAWLAELLTGPDRTPPRRPRRRRRPTAAGGRRLDRYVAAAIEGETHRIHAAPEGSRNQTLFTSSVALGQLVGADLLDQDHAQAVLLDAAHPHLAAGAYSRRQAEATIASGLRRGIQQPRIVNVQEARS